VAINEILKTNSNTTCVNVMSASPYVDRVFELNLWSGTGYVGTAALGCPAERSSTA
jgi:hypothetical protein